MGKLNDSGLVLGYRAILAIDFDRTIVSSDFPKINGLMPDAREVINRFVTVHDCYIIAWTSRNNEYEREAARYLKTHGIDYHVMNQNHPALVKVFEGDTRKVGYDVLIDDKNLEALLNPNFPNWLEIEQQVISIIYGPKFWTLLNHAV